LNSDIETQNALVSNLQLSVVNLTETNDELSALSSEQSATIVTLNSTVVNLENSLSNLEATNAAQLTSISSLNSDLETQNSNLLSLETQNSTLSNQVSNLLTDNEELNTNLIIALENEETHSLVERYLDIPESWSMFGYTCSDSVNVSEVFSFHEDQIEIVKDEWGLAWLVEYGFNALGSLQYGKGYQIKTNEEIENFQFCPNIE
jgi:predicted RNase H-like nuclease (RuvC/YqgF family)